MCDSNLSGEGVIAPPAPVNWRAYLIATAIAVVLSILAACVNLIVGPRNPILWVVPFFELIYAGLVYLIANAWNQQTVTFPLLPCCKRLIGKRVVRILN